MGVLDNLEDRLRAKFGTAGQTNAAARGALELISDLDQGLDTLALRFREAGLKDRVDSWVAKGRNLPVTAAEVKAALGPEVERYALKAQLTTEAAAARIAEILPEIVDKLTPEGAMPKIEEVRTSLRHLVAKWTGKDDDVPNVSDRKDHRP